MFSGSNSDCGFDENMLESLKIKRQQFNGTHPFLKLYNIGVNVYYVVVFCIY